MEKIPFDPKELESSGEYRSFRPDAKGIPILNTPITPRENFRKFAFNEEGGPVWMPSYPEIKMFNPQVIPENVARAIVAEAVPYNPSRVGVCSNSRRLYGASWKTVPGGH